jgi:glycyl-tRNA synthetase beta chain
VIGGHLARAQGEDPAVADAIRDHYKPVGQGDEVPTAPVTVAVSLADKLDTLIAFFYAGMPPTGSKDPFALRRAALGFLELVFRNNLRLSFWEWISRGLTRLSGERCSPEMPDEAYEAHKRSMKSVFDTLPAFFADRLKVQQREAGVRHDLIDAVFALGGEDDLVRLLARVKALQSFVETREGADLLAGYKRAANILKKEAWPATVTPAQAGVSGPDGRGAGHAEMPASAGMTKTLSYTPLPEEQKLIAALDSAEPAARVAVEAEDFEAAMRALASLRAPIFEDKVIDFLCELVKVNEKKVTREELFNLRFQNATGQLDNYRRLALLRRDVARISTILRERQLSGTGGGS